MKKKNAPPFSATKWSGPPVPMLAGTTGVEIRERPARIARRLNELQRLSVALEKNCRWRRTALLLGWPLWFASFFLYLLSGTVRHGASAAVLCGYCSVFLVFTYNLRAFLLRRFSGAKVPGISVGGWLLLGCMIWFAPTMLSMPPEALRGADSVGGVSTGAAVCYVLGLVYCVLMLGTANYFRWREVSVRTVELSFCRKLLDALLPEVPPSARCLVAFNPFPYIWSEARAERSKSRKAAIFDTLLRSRLPLGGERSIQLFVVHRRTSKGRNKHKGWKHKLKWKIVYQGPLATPHNDLQRSFMTELRKALEMVPAETAGRTAKKNGGVSLDQFRISSGEGKVTVVYSSVAEVTSNAELRDAQMPRAEHILATVQALCRAAGGGRPSGEARA